MNKNEWKWFFSSLRPHRTQMALMLISAWILGAIGAVLPILLQQLVDRAIVGYVDYKALAIYTAGLILTVVPIASIFRSRLCAKFDYHLRGRVLAHLLHLDANFHENKGSDTVSTQAGKGIDACSEMISLLGNGQLIVLIPVAIFATTYIAERSLLATGLLIAFMVLFAFVGKSLGRKLSSIEEEYQERDTELTSRLRESIENSSVVRVCNACGQETAKYWKDGKTALLLRHKLIWLCAKFQMFGNGAEVFASLVVAILFIPQVADGSITAGTLFALLLYAVKIMQPANFVGNFYAQMKQAGVKIKSLVEILETEPSVTESTNPLTLNPLRNAIEFVNVSFRYGGKSRDVLTGINLTIPAGKKTAIVGISGSGKTTLARLITRLYDPSLGLIEFDGTDLRHVSFATLYNQVAYLSQDVPIFSGTVEENVAFGIDIYNKSDVLYALQMAAAGFVHVDQEGINRIIGENGRKLSGGERQRIALARIFMRNPSVIVLDEATSALDTATEWEVTEMFNRLSRDNGGLTMVVIAHRLSTVLDADQIVVLDKGQIVDTGTHQELLSRCEQYQRLNRTLEKD